MTEERPSAEEGLRLQRAFARIFDPVRRRRLIEFAEQLADASEKSDPNEIKYYR